MKNSFDEKILEEANDWIKTNQKVVLATVIQTWGSSPRQTGSRMIVNEKEIFQALYLEVVLNLPLLENVLEL